MNRIIVLAAVSSNGAVGRNGDIPWHVPEDLKAFKAGTLGRPVIMGRKTFDSIGKPLPYRYNLVVSKHMQPCEGVQRAPSLMAAVNMAIGRTEGEGDIFIIGGGNIYAQSLHYANEIRITRVQCQVIAPVAMFPTDTQMRDAGFEKTQSTPLQVSTNGTCYHTEVWTK